MEYTSSIPNHFKGLDLGTLNKLSGDQTYTISMVKTAKIKNLKPNVFKKDDQLITPLVWFFRSFDFRAIIITKNKPKAPTINFIAT